MLQFVTIIFISQWNLNSFQLFDADKLEEYASLNVLSKCSTLQKTKPELEFLNSLWGLGTGEE